jgi:hypothetical protein
MVNSQPEQPTSHGFLIMGTEKLFLCHFPMYFTPEHSYQVILETGLEKNDMETLLKMRSQKPDEPLAIFNKKDMLLKDIVNSSSFPGVAFIVDGDGNPPPDVEPFIASATVTVKRSLLFEHLNPNSQYPDRLTYYLYGSDSDFHLSHVLTKAPNFQQELDVMISDEIQNKIKELKNEIPKISIPSLPERSAQQIKVDPLTQGEYTIRLDDGTTGKISVGKKFFINNMSLNMGAPGVSM